MACVRIIPWSIAARKRRGRKGYQLSIDQRQGWRSWGEGGEDRGIPGFGVGRIGVLDYHVLLCYSMLCINEGKGTAYPGKLASLSSHV